MGISMKSLVMLIIVATASRPAHTATFTVYEDYDRGSQDTFLWWGGGTSEEFTVNQNSCMNFNFYNDKISSLDPHGGCIKIWQDSNCEGASNIVTESRGCSKNLAACDISNVVETKEENSVTWDNQISSISACSDNEALDPIIDNGDLTQFDLLLVKSNNARDASGYFLINLISFFSHRKQHFSVTFCEHIDCKRQERIHAQAERDNCANFGSSWDRKVSAVYTQFDCIELFDQKNCEGESIKFRKSIYWFGPETPLNSCRFDLSTCKLENGQSWSWNDRARSVRNC